jgi:hypothetical protein
MTILSTIEIPLVGNRGHCQNTYKSSPDNGFPIKEVEKIIRQVLEENLLKGKYDLYNSREQSKTISQIIKDKVKELKVLRYKLVVVVHCW